MHNNKIKMRFYAKYFRWRFRFEFDSHGDHGHKKALSKNIDKASSYVD